MNFAICFMFVLIWLAYMIASGVLLFSRGFLLSRVSKQDVSSCRQLSLNKNDNYYITEDLVQEIFKDVNASSNLCLPQKSKVIVLVIDALKYEFGVYRENGTQLLPYENKLSVLHDLIKESPDNARLMRFKADPPTTTLQRLKGLTTGSLPTFIDIGSNFASPEINEDNIVDQMVQHGLPVVFMGDSTWTDLYPKRFRRSYAYPSFDIFDLDTVDTKIQKHLPIELERDDWQVLIAHFLGVDHCGHRYGPMHTEMERKLIEMNNMIKSVVNKMDAETTLFVIGDHGMTASGDHGGDTDDETNALLFAYNKQNKFLSSNWGSAVDVLQQIDFVPTLATILGIPIPYSNLGLVNFNIVPDVLVPNMTKLQVVLLHAWQNAQQIFKYFYNYALENKRTFSVDDMDRMETEYILLSHRVKTIYNEGAFKSFVADLNKHLRSVLNTCRELWVRFDPMQISHGLLITIMPICFMFLLVNNSRPTELFKIFTTKQVFYTYLLNLAAAVFGYRFYQDLSFKSEEHAVICCTNLLGLSILIVHTIKNWPNIVTNWSSQPPLASMSTRLLLIGLVSIFFSNSFIIQEAKILFYLLAGVMLHMLFTLLRINFPIEFRTRLRISTFLRSMSLKLILATFLAIMLMRACFNLFRCREEQGDCIDLNSNAGNFSMKTASSGKTYILAVILVVIYTTLTRLYLRSCGNLTGNSVNVLLARYGPTVAAICVGGHILLSSSSLKTIQRSHIDAMALVVFALLFLQLLVFAISPMMAYVLPPRQQQIVVNEASSIVPEIFKKMKRMYEGDEVEGKYEIPVVYGLATIYSSIVITFGIFLTIFLLVLLAPVASMGLVICITVGAILLTMHSILRFRTAQNFESCIQPTFTAVVGWFLLAHFTFFATSHQTTLSQIDWRAAFVGRTSNSIGQSQLISAILVILSTFCGQLLFFTMFGLLATETFSIYALFPNMVRFNRVRDNRRVPDPGQQTSSSIPRALSDISLESVGFDMTRGELTLFENETIFIGSSFKLAVQFFMLQGIKVFCAMLACTLHSRHLMVWKIFAPRFIYEGLATFVSLPAIVVGYLLFVRVHFAVDKLITKINKIK